jgi:hypothetical protein
MFQQCEDISKGFISYKEYMNCHWQGIQTFEYINEDAIIFSKIPEGLFIFNIDQKRKLELVFFNKEVKAHRAY